MVFKTREESDGKVVVIECPVRVDLSVAKDLREIMKESTELDKFLLSWIWIRRNLWIPAVLALLSRELP